MSDVAPMSANIALILFECNSTGMAGKQHYKIQLSVNEKPVGLPCCHGNTTCTLGRFLSCYEDTVNSCDFDAICSLPATGKRKAFALRASPSLGVILLILVTLFVLSI